MNNKALRIIFASLSSMLLFTLLVLAGTWGFLRGTAGDFVVVILLYTIARTIKPTGWRWIPLGVFAFACLVEGLQAIDILSILGITHSTIQIAVGSVFDWIDILAYAVGCTVAALLDYGIAKIEKE